MKKQHIVFALSFAVFLLGASCAKYESYKSEKDIEEDKKRNSVLTELLPKAQEYANLSFPMQEQKSPVLKLKIALVANIYGEEMDFAIKGYLESKVIFTSDNPRTEDPLSIIRDIAAGAGMTDYQMEVDRALAIYQAIANAQPGDIVLVAGKGHEKFQEIQGQKIPFNDAEVVQQVLKDLAMKMRVPT